MLGDCLPEENEGGSLFRRMPDGDRLRELEGRNRELEMENAFLKKTAAYFAREHR